MNPQGFPVLAQGLRFAPRLFICHSQIAVSNRIVAGDRHGPLEQGFTVFPIPKLFEAEDNTSCHAESSQRYSVSTEMTMLVKPLAEFESDRPEYSDQGDIGVSVGHRLAAYLY